MGLPSLRSLVRVIHLAPGMGGSVSTSRTQGHLATWRLLYHCAKAHPSILLSCNMKK